MSSVKHPVMGSVARRSSTHRHAGALRGGRCDDHGQWCDALEEDQQEMRRSERRGGQRQQEEMAHGNGNSSALVATREEGGVQDGDKSLPIDGSCMVMDRELKRCM